MRPANAKAPPPRPGLTAKEKKYALPFVISSVTLFLAGAVVAYLTLPTGLRLLLTIGGDGLTAFLDAEKYLSFVGVMGLGFGLMFELPIFLFFLGLVGILSSTQLRRQRKGALVAIVALAAVVTPSQDPYTLLALAGPLFVMYELAILALRLVERAARSAPVCRTRLREIEAVPPRDRRGAARAVTRTGSLPRSHRPVPEVPIWVPSNDAGKPKVG